MFEQRPVLPLYNSKLVQPHIRTMSIRLCNDIFLFLAEKIVEKKTASHRIHNDKSDLFASNVR